MDAEMQVVSIYLINILVVYNKLACSIISSGQQGRCKCSIKGSLSAQHSDIHYIESKGFLVFSFISSSVTPLMQFYTNSMCMLRYGVSAGVLPFAIDEAATARSVAVLKEAGLVPTEFCTAALWDGADSSTTAKE